MALITRRRLLQGSGLAATGLIAAPAIVRADSTMVSKGIYWKRVPCQKDHVYSKHLVPDVWFLEIYAPPEQSFSRRSGHPSSFTTPASRAPIMVTLFQWEV